MTRCAMPDNFVGGFYHYLAGSDHLVLVVRSADASRHCGKWRVVRSRRLQAVNE